MRKVLIILVAVVGLGLGGYRGFPWALDLLLEMRCPDASADACAARVRAMGHIWVERDNLDRAGRWYLKGARAGDVQAMFHLGWVYQQVALSAQRQQVRWALAEQAGLAADDPQVPRTPKADLATEKRRYAEAALAWYRRSAESGFSAAMNNLGLMYSLGLHAAQDHEEAFRWYLASARAGNPIGSMNLMLTYLFGRGTQRDPQEAEKWASWRPQNGLTDDLKSPTLVRTMLWGVPERPAQIQERMRLAATAGDTIFLSISPVEPHDDLPTFAAVERQLAREMR